MNNSTLSPYQDLFLTGNPALDDKFFEQAKSVLDPEYAQTLDMYKGDAMAKLANEKNQYNTFLQGKQNQFGQDALAADSSEAKNGTLFSTGRDQRRTNLANTYNNSIQNEANASQFAMGNIARDYEGQYGSGAAAGLDTSEAAPGSVNASTFSYSGPGAARSTYTPIGGIYGNARRQNMANTGALASLYKRGSSGNLGSLPYGLSQQQ